MSEPVPSRTLAGEAILADALVQELLAVRLVGVLATLEPDGSVHAVPMWLACENDEIVLATGSRSRKARNLERDPRATLVLHDSRPGAEVCGVSMRGTVELVRGEEAVPLVERVHLRYVQRDGLRMPEVEAFLSFDDVAIRFRAQVAVTWDERGSDAARRLRESHLAYALEPTSPRGR